MTDPATTTTAAPSTDDQVADDQATDDKVTDDQVTDAQVTDGTDDEVTDVSPTAEATDEPTDEQDGEEGAVRVRRLEHEGDIAADYLEGLLDIADLDGDIDMDVEGDRAAVSVVGDDVEDLVGEEGEVLDALQELTRLAVLRETGERSRLMLDVAGFRARRRTELAALGARTAAEVRETGEAVALPAMSPFERKVVHDAVAAAGLRSASEGEEPERHIVVHPA